MTSFGVIRKWRQAKGWGVIDSDDTPGGCWSFWTAIDLGDAAHDSLRIAGLEPGQPVDFDWVPATQDGYLFRATRVVPITDAAQPNAIYRK